MVPGYVPRTMTNDVKVLLDFHGTAVTPGHVYYRPDSKRADKYETLIDVLRDDGMIEDRDGVKLRAATYAPVDGPLDKFVQAVTGTLGPDGGVDIKEQGRIRLGARFIVRNDRGRKDYSVADLIEAGGGVVGGRGFVAHPSVPTQEGSEVFSLPSAEGQVRRGRPSRRIRGRSFLPSA